MDFSNLPEDIIKTIIFLKEIKNNIYPVDIIYDYIYENEDIFIEKYIRKIFENNDIFEIRIITTSPYKYCIKLKDNVYKHIIRQEKINKINK